MGHASRVRVGPSPTEASHRTATPTPASHDPYTPRTISLNVLSPTLEIDNTQTHCHLRVVHFAAAVRAPRRSEKW